MEYIDYEKKIASRIFQLRTQKGVSARDMSLSLGQSESYINKIENGRALPSMTVFFYICEYFEITPEQFFCFNTENPTLNEGLKKYADRLTSKQTADIIEIIKDILEK
ncbi:MAG: helix-turn-helix domain-containing protein [Ruminiclostridium sp.]|nr:helix-turn-helix domain-containing protein [Ruminiclostridium sp.]